MLMKGSIMKKLLLVVTMTAITQTVISAQEVAVEAEKPVKVIKNVEAPKPVVKKVEDVQVAVAIEEPKQAQQVEVKKEAPVEAKTIEVVEKAPEITTTGAVDVKQEEAAPKKVEKKNP